MNCIDDFLYLYFFEFDNKTENYYNYNGAECSNTNWFRQPFFVFQNYQNQGQSTVGKEKRKERKDDKKRRIKSKFVCINCIQFLRLKIQK